jgi:hypothetical protein
VTVGSHGQASGADLQQFTGSVWVAEALLATVDYEAELRRPRLPPGACAASPA